MDEEYRVASPWAVWRQRLIIGALLVAIVVLAWGFEVLYDTLRVSSGPNAWFVVDQQAPMGRAAGREELLNFDHYSTESQCNQSIEQRYKIMFTCRRLLISDARKMMQSSY